MRRFFQNRYFMVFHKCFWKLLDSLEASKNHIYLPHWRGSRTLHFNCPSSSASVTSLPVIVYFRLWLSKQKHAKTTEHVPLNQANSSDKACRRSPELAGTNFLKNAGGWVWVSLCVSAATIFNLSILSTIIHATLIQVFILNYLLKYYWKCCFPSG